MPPSDHGGLPGRLLGFAEELRDEGVAIGTAELLDAFAALGEVPWTEREDVREALAATLAKSQEDRRIFELVFERFFFRATEMAAARQGISEQDAASLGGRVRGWPAWTGGAAAARSGCGRSPSRSSRRRTRGTTACRARRCAASRPSRAATWRGPTTRAH